MELRDYLRMLRHGWWVVLASALLGVVLATGYLSLTPRQYESSTTLYVGANAPTSIDDLKQGAEFSANAVTSYAAIIDSATVLAPVTLQVRPRRDVDDLMAAVSTTVVEESTLITISATAADPDSTADIANATADSASRIIPELQTTPARVPLVSVQQMGRALPPQQPISPDTTSVLGIGLLVGLCLGLAGTITRQSLETRIRRAEDLRGLTTAPLLATLPRLGRPPGRALARLRGGTRGTLVVRDQPSSSGGEAFRTLRTNLRFLESTGRRTLVFTGVSDDDEGARVPANLAWALTQAGRRVLLVDLDMRRNAVGDALGVSPAVGLSDVLTRRSDLAECVRETRNPLLRVLLSGRAAPNPSDLLSAPLMTSVLQRLEQENDYVLLHAPPMLAYADAAVASTVAGGTLVSVAVGNTRAPDLSAALTMLANVGVSPLGIILTGASRADRGAPNTPSSHGSLPPVDPPTQLHYPVKPIPRARASNPHRQRRSRSSVLHERAE